MGSRRIVISDRPVPRRAPLRQLPPAARPGSGPQAARARRRLGASLAARLERPAGLLQVLHRVWRMLTGRPALDAVAAPWLEPQAVAALDDALAQLAPQMPAAALRQLADLKDSVARLARHPVAEVHLAFDDRMYVLECVRRYVPDALQAWLAVPAARRAQPLAQGRSADALLQAQLALLQRGLAQREARLASGGAEALLQHERFLRGKVER